MEAATLPPITISIPTILLSLSPCRSYCPRVLLLCASFTPFNSFFTTYTFTLSFTFSLLFVCHVSRIHVTNGGRRVSWSVCQYLLYRFGSSEVKDPQDGLPFFILPSLPFLFLFSSILSQFFLISISLVLCSRLSFSPFPWYHIVQINANDLWEGERLLAGLGRWIFCPLVVCQCECKGLSCWHQPICRLYQTHIFSSLFTNILPYSHFLCLFLLYCPYFSLLTLCSSTPNLHPIVLRVE